MLNILITGAAGHMGKILTNIIEEDPDLSVAGKVDPAGGDGILTSLSDFNGSADMLIDFSHHSACSGILAFCRDKKIPAVLATTGYTEEETQMVQEAAKELPLFRSANMSLGIALLTHLVKTAAKAFPNCDVEIVEAHHNRKADAPSGTALMLADAVKEVRPESVYVEGRSGMQKREPGDIGINAIRMGNVVGMHEVFFSTNSQTITLKHEAHDRALFAEGAISAAKFLAGKPAGLYNMDDILEQ
ncbi:MAG: 4-hydroxy-tetrahydrodipicolinate reductase [Anaerovoracaceae bacterium]|jgi:4-hydroxy-tetrahydrodipicolinate reductase